MAAVQPALGGLAQASPVFVYPQPCSRKFSTRSFFLGRWCRALGNRPKDVEPT